MKLMEMDETDGDLMNLMEIRDVIPNRAPSPVRNLLLDLSSRGSGVARNASDSRRRIRLAHRRDLGSSRACSESIALDAPSN